MPLNRMKKIYMAGIGICSHMSEERDIMYDFDIHTKEKSASTFAKTSLQYAFPVCRTCFRFEGMLMTKIHGQKYVACRVRNRCAVRARLRSTRSCGKYPCKYYLRKTRQIDGHEVILPK